MSWGIISSLHLPAVLLIDIYFTSTPFLGWKWRSFRNAKWPSYWVGEGPQGLNQFSLRLLFDVVPMAWDLPVCVNMHEATAFAIWKSQKSGSTYRVISELEHHAIRDKSQQLSDMTEAVDMVVQDSSPGKMMSEVSNVQILYDVLLSYAFSNI